MLAHSVTFRSLLFQKLSFLGLFLAAIVGLPQQADVLVDGRPRHRNVKRNILTLNYLEGDGEIEVSQPPTPPRILLYSPFGWFDTGTVQYGEERPEYSSGQEDVDDYDRPCNNPYN